MKSLWAKMVFDDIDDGDYRREVAAMTIAMSSAIVILALKM